MGSCQPGLLTLGFDQGRLWDASLPLPSVCLVQLASAFLLPIPKGFGFLAHHGLAWPLRDGLAPRTLCQGSTWAFWLGIFLVADL